jgi:CubicO group peptidase (beta-lactamase class C family)
MNDTAFFVAEDKLDRFAANYSPVDGGKLALNVPQAFARDSRGRGIKLIDAPEGSTFARPPSVFSGGGGLTSTMGDYARFCQMLLNKGELDGARLLGRKTVEYIASNHLPDGNDMAAMGQPIWSETSTHGIGYGLGMAVTLNPAQAQVMGSTGEYHWGGAASTGFWIDPAEDMFVILMTQLMPSSAYPLRRELRVLSYQTIVD